MLRVHFTAADLARTTIADQPDPLWEVLLSLHQTQTRDGQPTFGSWRRRAATAPRADLALLRELAPPTGYSPDFLTPGAAGDDLGTALDRLSSTPTARLHTELAYLATRTPATPWTRDLGSGRAEAVRRLSGAVRSYYDTALGPYWPSIRRHLANDRARRVDTMARHGIEGMLAGLHPRIRWRAPVLEILDFADADLHLDGRGLLLQPSFFCWVAPTKLRDPTLPQTLVYATAPPPGALDPDTGPAGLAALLGRTRALALEATASGCTTSELARRCGVSLASASQQAAVLRGAGLITTRRDGGAVRHEITHLGLGLLNARS
ncbi:ArsR/SmtB family transcription factor [Catenuloplanes sp. NPDC051500]|uniref:ArsR/SmtB family transcription factor n=1 Tax=Catenuloplanes sp. NPDC051500 TaxID=3363959 RepID=UPI00379DCE92